MAKKTSDKCVICGAKLVEKVVQEFDHPTGPPKYGPISRRQYKEVSEEGYICPTCGLWYYQLPRRDKTF